MPSLLKKMLGSQHTYKLVKGFAIGMGGAALAWAAQHLTGLDFGGQGAPVVAAVGGVLINGGLKWLAAQEAALAAEPDADAPAAK